MTHTKIINQFNHCQNCLDSLKQLIMSNENCYSLILSQEVSIELTKLSIMLSLRFGLNQINETTEKL
jgi:hypothetical protein